MATAGEWWVQFYGQGTQDAEDYTGRWIKKASYDQHGSRYGWVLEYIMPLDKGGSKTADNVWIVSCEAHALRDGKITYTMDGVRYQVQRNGKGGYGIYKIGDKKMNFWEQEFGDATEAEDFTGRVIQKGAYGQTNSRYGWDIDHIQPLSLGGKDTDENAPPAVKTDSGEQTTNTQEITKPPQTVKQPLCGGFLFGKIIFRKSKIFA